MRASRTRCIILVATVAFCGLLHAQTPALENGHGAPAQPMTLRQAIDAALANYPSIRVTQEQMNAASAKIRLAQTAFLPRVNGLAQVNRATRNTYYGMLLPNSVIPALDGAPVNNLGSVWDTGAGLLVTWQPFDFGLRHANVAAATAGQEYAQTAVALSRFDVEFATADAFLTMIAAQEMARAAHTAVASWETLLKTTHALVGASLRPGADESRIQSELAIARTQLVQGEEAIATAQSNISRFVGVPTSQVQIQPGATFQQLPTGPEPSPPDLRKNPVALKQNAQIALEASRLKSLEKTYRPEFLLQASASARGTGLNIRNDARMGGLNGLAPTTQNYGLGLTVNFSFTDLAGIRAQEAAQSATIRAERAHQQVIARDLQAQWDAAQATLTGARAVAANTPIEISSARTAVEQASARYRAGLASIDNFAQAERLLSQAEMDDALARLNVWRAILQLQGVQGNIKPFVSEASQ